MADETARTAVLALHWQANIIRPEGFFGPLLAGPVAAGKLPTWLAEHGRDRLLITGVATNLTVEQTARHGTDLGFTVHPVTDCIAAATPEEHAASLSNLELTTAGCLSATQALESFRIR